MRRGTIPARAIATHLDLVELGEHVIAQGVHPSLRRAVARRRELREGLCSRRGALQDDVLGFDLVDLLGRVGVQLVAKLLGEVVRALVLVLGLGGGGGLIGGAARLDLLDGAGEVVDDRREALC